MIVPSGRKVRWMLQYVGRPLLILLVYDLAVVFAYKVLHWGWLASPHIPLALFGSAIGIIVAFRNQSAYARWWEARKLWGAIVNNSRSLGRQIVTVMMPPPVGEEKELEAMQRRLVYHQIAYVHALRQQLRRLEPWTELSPLLREPEISELRRETNVPLAIQRHIGAMLRECQVRGWIDIGHWRAMDGCLNQLLDAQGGTERIKSTPLPKQYDHFPQLFVEMYCAMLPLALVTNLGWLTPLGSTLVGFIFLALDRIGRDLEDPFDNTIYDVPITAITTMIEVNLRQLLGETNVPALEVPLHDVLW